MRRLIFVIAIFFWGGPSFAQDCGSEGSSKAMRYFREAMQRLDAGQTETARTKLLQAAQADPEFAQPRFLLSQMALDDGKWTRAQRHLEVLLDLCPDFGREALYIEAELAFAQNEFSRAHTLYSKFQPEMLERHEDRDAARKHAAIAEKLHALQENPWEISPTPVTGISTESDEYLAIISPDGSRCFYTRRYLKQSRNLLTPVSVEEFSVSFRPSDAAPFEPGQPMPPPFNQAYKEGGPTVTADNRELFFTICTPDKTGRGGSNCDIYTCVSEGGQWGPIRPLPAHINLPDQWESQPSISGDGRTLYFSSSRLDGLGGLDIWKVQRDLQGMWGKPENLGPAINTSGNEKAPFIHSDSRTLYFASDGMRGLVDTMCFMRGSYRLDGRIR